MDRICRRVIDEVEATHPNQPIALTVVGNVEGSWDADRIAQALCNLIVNAFEHAGGEVRVDVAGGADEVMVSVSNPGHFPEAVRATLFAPFRKGDAGGRGLGLGLFIVREVVDAHHGRVELSTDGGVTRFTTCWPRYPRSA